MVIFIKYILLLLSFDAYVVNTATTWSQYVLPQEGLKSTDIKSCDTIDSSKLSVQVISPSNGLIILNK